MAVALFDGTRRWHSGIRRIRLRDASTKSWDFLLVFCYLVTCYFVVCYWVLFGYYLIACHSPAIYYISNESHQAPLYLKQTFLNHIKNRNFEGIVFCKQTKKDAHRLATSGAPSFSPGLRTVESTRVCQRGSRMQAVIFNRERAICELFANYAPRRPRWLKNLHTNSLNAIRLNRPYLRPIPGGRPGGPARLARV